MWQRCDVYSTHNIMSWAREASVWWHNLFKNPMQILIFHIFTHSFFFVVCLTLQRHFSNLKTNFQRMMKRLKKIRVLLSYGQYQLLSNRFTPIKAVLWCIARWYNTFDINTCSAASFCYQVRQRRSSVGSAGNQKLIIFVNIKHMEQIEEWPIPTYVFV